MAWFKVDDDFHSHPKVLKIPRAQRADAIGTWTLCGTWAARHETDGVIPNHILEEIGGTLTGAAALVTARLWRKRVSGYVFHDWNKYQPTKAELDEKRAAEAARKAAYRANQSKSASGNVPTGQGRTDAGTNAVSEPPDPTRPDPLKDKSPSGGNSPKQAAKFAPQPCGNEHDPGKSCGACAKARRDEKSKDAEEAKAKAARNKAIEKAANDARKAEAAATPPDDGTGATKALEAVKQALAKEEAK